MRAIHLIPTTPRPSLWLALAAGLTLSAGAVASAHELEVTGSVGAHFYAEGNELGRDDGAPSSTAPQHTVMFGLTVGYYPIPHLGIEAEATLVPGTTRAGDGSTIVAVGYRGHLVVNILTGRLRPFLLFGGGAYSSVYTSANSGIYQDTDLQFHAGAGLKYYVTPRLMLRLDGRVLATPAINYDLVLPEFEVMLGVGGHFAFKSKAKDTDGDGIIDSVDQCPTEAEDKDGYEDRDGCPDPDNDQDGILDGADRCPNQPGPAENNGCPDTDRDGDGILDRLDQCPDKAGSQADHGCPLPDKDADGVLDKNDKCPDQPGPAALGGCPDKDGDGIADKDDKCPDQAGPGIFGGCPDKDGDGIPDKDDKCPDQPETWNGFEDTDGCPDVVPVILTKFMGTIKGITFKTGKAEIIKTSYKVLDTTVSILNQYPSIRLEVSGYTDAAGSPAKNRELSQQRADAVRAYLIAHGIDGKRLQAKGYGADKPLGNNKTKAGKALNRRIEFQIAQ